MKPPLPRINDELTLNPKRAIFFTAEIGDVVNFPRL